MHRGNPMVRVYRPVLNAYRDVAKEYDVKVADLVSIILARVGLRYEELITTIFIEEFGFDYMDARDATVMLGEKLEEEFAKEIEKQEKKLEAGLVA